MASYASNKIIYLLAIKIVDFSPAADVFKIILMQTGFSFNIDTHHGYANVIGSELATAFGYVAGGNVLAGVNVNENDVDDRTEVTWNDSSWTAAGGPIGPSPGAIVFDDTVAAPLADPIVGYIDFGGDQTQSDGGVARVTNIEFRLRQPS